MARITVGTFIISSSSIDQVEQRRILARTKQTCRKEQPSTLQEMSSKQPVEGEEGGRGAGDKEETEGVRVEDYQIDPSEEKHGGAS